MPSRTSKKLPFAPATTSRKNPPSKPLEKILERAENVRQDAGGYLVSCPNPDHGQSRGDREPSVRVSEGNDGRVLVHCFAGCEKKSVVAGWGLAMSDLFEKNSGRRFNMSNSNPRQERSRSKPSATWEIKDTSGKVQAHHVRFDTPEGKEVLWRLPGARKWGLAGRKLATLPLYGSERIKEWSEESLIVVCEGEKATDALLDAGILAVGTVTGASSAPGSDALKVLKERRVVLWPDNDRPGAKHMERVALDLQSIASEVRIFDWSKAPEKGDAEDHPALAGGGSKEAFELVEALNDTPLWKPGMDFSQRVENIGTLLSEVDPERVEWLWESRIPYGKITIVEGNPGLGKSTLMTDIAARVSRGKAWPDGSKCKAGGVVLLSAEDGLADTIRPRFDAAGGDPTKAVTISTVPDAEGNERQIAIPDDLSIIEQVIERVQARLVVIDPLMAFLAENVNSHRDQDVRRALAPLARLAERTSAAIVVVRHLNKATGGSAIYRGGGSIGIIGAARSGLLIAEHPEDDTKRVMASVKNNLAAPASSLVFSLASTENGAARVAWSGQTILDANSLLSAPVDQEEKSALSEAEDFLLDILQDGSVTAKDAEKEAKEAGIEPRTLKRAKQKLKVASEREGTSGQRGGGRWVWRLPESVKGAKEKTGPLNSDVDRTDSSDTPYISRIPSTELRGPGVDGSFNKNGDGSLNNGHRETEREELTL